MRNIAMHAARIFTILLVGGLLGATLVRFAPGYGVDEQELNSHLNHESIEALRRTNDGDRNLATFYIHYLTRLVRGDLGMSRTLQQPVRHLLAERFPQTLESAALGLLLGWTLGLAMAIASIMSRSWSFDLFGSLFAGVLLCVPAAMLALLFVIAHVPGRLVLSLIVFPKVFRYARNMLQRTASMPHVLTARAKGLAETRVFLWHILPVSATQLLALAGVSISVVFAAAIPVEVLCDLPGIGQLAWKAALGRDMELLVSLTLIVTAVTLLANSASDLLSNHLRVGAA